MKKNYSFWIIFMLVYGSSFAQDITQNIRGTVISADTDFPLIGATLQIQEIDVGTTTDLNGEFLFSNIPIGRYTILVSYLGFENKTLSSINIGSGKEVILTIPLQESVVELQEVVINAARDKAGSLNKLATVSSRQFTIEEATRYAGSRNEPARMAQNYAGVSGSSDSRNDIIIRGNSPLGLLWRFEGLDIPNPNHFALAGSNGGVVSILNANVLSNSDFLTGAFPAGYGNSTSGVFDLKMRKGNNENKEFLFSVGALGFETMLEGNFSKDSKSSYLFNYRYSTTKVITDLVKINIGYSGAPVYQDASFKVNIPTKKIGVISIFGMGGLSNYKVNAIERDSSNFDIQFTDNANYDFKATMGVLGVSHKYLINDKSYIHTTIGATVNTEESIVDSVSLDIASIVTPIQRNDNVFSGIQVHSIYTNKLTKKLLSTTGIIYKRQGFNVDERILDRRTGQLEPFRDGEGSTSLTQVYSGWQYRPKQNMTINAGIHYQHFDLNKTNTVEWRAGAKIQLDKTGRTTLNFGTGLHSQAQLLPLYFVQATPNQAQTNRELDFSRSLHFVTGIDHSINSDLRFKGELYYQSLSRVPIHRADNPSSFSMINEGGDFSINYENNLVSEGVASNYGVELTLEKFYSRGYYFLFTNSIFKSQYEGSNGIQYSTKFDGLFISNLLAGKEFDIGKSNKFLIDIKTTIAGGRRYTPINLEASRAQGKAVFYEELSFMEKHKNYLRTDLKLTYRINRPNMSHEVYLNLDNIFNIRNIFAQYYNALTENIVTINQLGVFPIMQYKLEF